MTSHHGVNRTHLPLDSTPTLFPVLQRYTSLPDQVRHTTCTASCTYTQTSHNFTFSAHPAFVCLFAEPLMLKNDEKQRLARERREELEKQNGMTNIRVLSLKTTWKCLCYTFNFLNVTHISESSSIFSGKFSTMGLDFGFDCNYHVICILQWHIGQFHISPFNLSAAFS